MLILVASSTKYLDVFRGIVGPIPVAVVTLKEYPKSTAITFLADERE
jgi:hypothetical protein